VLPDQGGRFKHLTGRVPRELAKHALTLLDHFRQVGVARGETKNLIFGDGASPEEILLVDDYEEYVHPGQDYQWIKVPYFDCLYLDDDLGLRGVLRLLRIRVKLMAISPFHRTNRRLC
jgi:hypothetical protein